MRLKETNLALSRAQSFPLCRNRAHRLTGFDICEISRCKPVFDEKEEGIYWTARLTVVRNGSRYLFTGQSAQGLPSIVCHADLIGCMSCDPFLHCDLIGSLVLVRGVIEALY